MKATAGAAFLFLLGAAGGIEQGTLAPGPGFILMVLCLGVFGASVFKINRKEVHKMDEVKRMEQYVERSRVFDHGHGMTRKEWLALTSRAEGGTANACQAVALAFNYGRAKGYREAKRQLAPTGKTR